MNRIRTHLARVDWRDIVEKLIGVAALTGCAVLIAHGFDFLPAIGTRLVMLAAAAGMAGFLTLAVVTELARPTGTLQSRIDGLDVENDQLAADNRGLTLDVAQLTTKLTAAENLIDDLAGDLHNADAADRDGEHEEAGNYVAWAQSKAEAYLNAGTAPAPAQIGAEL